MTISDLFNSISVADFYNHYWGKQVLHIPRNKLDVYNTILKRQDIDDFFSRERAIYPSMVMIKDGRQLPLNEWTKTKKNRAVEIVDFKKSMEAFSQGASIVLNAFHKDILPLGHFCRSIETEWSCICTANVYISPPSSQGFNKHIDNHDVLVLQHSGSKNWKIYPPNSDGALLDLTLNPGDLLYIPSGTYHEAKATDSYSMHISIGIQTPKLHELFKVIASSAANTDYFKQSLPLSIASEKQKAIFFEDVAKNIQNFVADIDLKNLTDNLVEKYQSFSVADYQGKWMDLFSINEISITSNLQRTKTKVSLRKESRFLYVETEGMELRYPIFLEKTIEFMLETDQFTIQEIPGDMPAASKVNLAKKWLHAGIFTVVD